MTIYFTSDSHFWHNNVIGYDERAYEDVEAMNMDLIRMWNEQVSSDDVVYHLGDFSFGSLEKKIEILKQLNGKIFLIKGNHDKESHWQKIEALGLIEEFHEVGIMMKYKKHVMWLTHYPMEIGLRPRKWSIHGHIHNNPSSHYNQINVGLDSPHFKHKPFGELITQDELFEIMEKRLPAIEERFIVERAV